MPTITFNTSAKQFILEAFNKIVDSDGFLVEKNNPNQRILTPDGQEIEIDRFAGVRKGSEVYIRSDLISLINLYDALK